MQEQSINVISDIKNKDSNDESLKRSNLDNLNDI